MVKYVTVGNLTIDEILLPDGSRGSRQCGGNCLYAAVGARIWSDSVGIVSLAGTDFPREWLDRVRAAGIDIQGISDLLQPHGMRAGFVYDAEGERTTLEDGAVGRGEYEKYPHEWEEWRLHTPSADQFPPAYADAAGLHFAPTPVRAQEALVGALGRPGRRLTLDSPWWDSEAGRYEPHRELLASLDALLPSMAEVRVFFRAPLDPVDAARALGQLGPAAVVVKVGVQGSLVYNPKTDAVAHIPAYRCRAIDPTGAGDAFCGGFLVGLVETGDPVEAARYGTVSASFVIEGFSSLHALHVTRREAEARRTSLEVQNV